MGCDRIGRTDACRLHRCRPRGGGIRYRGDGALRDDGSDFLLLLFGAVTVYVLLELKRMLFERYSYRGLDVIIAVAIAWTTVNYGGSFALQSFFSVVAPMSIVSAEVATTVFWVVCIGVFGIIDAILGIMLLIQGRRFGSPLLVFAVFSVAMGLAR